MAICAALLVIVVDNTVLNVAMPSIARSFDASTTAQQAVIAAYVVVFAGLLIAAGAASDRYGRRRAMLAGLAVLGVASAAAALAWSVWWLIAMRALMGAGAALVMPATLAVLVQVFPEHERPRAFGAWAAAASVAMAAGPVLGGLLVAVWSWAGVFLINVPVVAVAMLFIARLVPESRDPGRPVDPVSAVLVTAGMTALVTAVIGFSAASGVLAVVLLGAFGWRQVRAVVPVVEFALYRDRQFAGGSVAAALLTLGTGSALFVLVAAGLVLAGGGTGFAGPATTSTVLGAVLAERAGMGSALNDTHQQLGIALGVAVLGSVLAAVYRSGLPAAVPAGALVGAWVLRHDRPAKDQ
ncbi:hypothetical protein GCM10010470_29420 [Saccharopolyspora taberi]|uniref:Major facilitator superfamily (MFS) profile domain-containing protein n=1 Tax=Saccharopolyspora taberi TaxID=60895 RepID=A0ABN3VDU7_9PSEU